MTQEQIAFVYGWPPEVLDDLTLDRLEQWQATAEARIKQNSTRARCAFG